ncbi:MAG: MBOAT family protein, partial [Gammaproteobacteria bacterium]|nr:MBOAT family protein [Gammaproteobacteria bacterium]
VVVADNVGRIADEIFNNHEKYQGVDIAIGAFAFALQILGDFSGYSNIARGTSRLMGFDLMINFRLPYFATSPADFWRRWHISLSTWLRDYLYIPLGGNRNGSLRTYRNLLATMLLGGLWYGAAWNYMLWGAYHGVGLIVHRAISTLRQPDEVRRGRFANFFVVWLKIVCMFAFTLGGWLLFRSTSIGQSLDMAASFGVGVSDASLAMITGVLFYAWPLVAAQFLQWRKGDLFALINLPAPVVTVLGAAILAMIAVFGARQPMEFIYFQF